MDSPKRKQTQAIIAEMSCFRHILKVSNEHVAETDE